MQKLKAQIKTLHFGGAYLALKQKLTFFFFFFFDLFGIDGLKNFIIQDHESVIQKILFGIEKMARTDKFSMNVCQTLNKKEIDN